MNMGKWALGLIMSFLFGAGYAQPTVEVLYLNGVLNTADDAFSSVRQLQSLSARRLAKISSECPALNFMSGTNFFTGAIFNPTGGTVFDGSEAAYSNAFSDVSEFARSKALEEEWAPLFDGANTFNSRALAALGADQLTYSRESEAIRQVTEKGVARISALVKQNSRVVLISHSQGSTIANRIYIKLLQALSEPELAKVEFVSVGSGAAFQPSALNFKFDNDLITGATGIASGLGRNVQRGTCLPGVSCAAFQMSPGSGVVGAGADWAHHNFVDSYLADIPVNIGGPSPRELVGNLVETAFRGLLKSECAQIDGVVLRLLPTTSVIAVGGAVTIKAQLLDSSGNMVPFITPLQWTSSNSLVASVSEVGRVSGNALGTALISSSLPNTSISGTATVQVQGTPRFPGPQDVPPPTSIPNPEELVFVRSASINAAGIAVGPIVWGGPPPSLDGIQFQEVEIPDPNVPGATIRFVREFWWCRVSNAECFKWVAGADGVPP